MTYYIVGFSLPSSKRQRGDRDFVRSQPINTEPHITAPSSSEVEYESSVEDTKSRTLSMTFDSEDIRPLQRCALINQVTELGQWKGPSLAASDEMRGDGVNARNRREAERAR